MVLEWLANPLPSLEIIFHDYVTKDTLAQSDESELFELEYRYCRMPTYRDMGRYIHLLAKRSP